ncbi:hypothetical protein OOU_Y34scaffold00022g36 [Pyricularia oryzae Y34]|nr:hypothetical protein OOU_Y34scaffold00022g36 [Pyricularia oryzae Y34]
MLFPRPQRYSKTLADIKLQIARQCTANTARRREITLHKLANGAGGFVVINHCISAQPITARYLGTTLLAAVDGPIKARGTEYQTRQPPMRFWMHASGKRLCCRLANKKLSCCSRIQLEIFLCSVNVPSLVPVGVGGADLGSDLRHPTQTPNGDRDQLSWATYHDSPWSPRRAAISYLARFISNLPGTSHSRLRAPYPSSSPPSTMSAHPYHRHPEPRGRELSRRPSASDEDSFFSESSSIVGKHNHHRPRSHHRDPPRGRRAESSRHRADDDEHYLPHHDRHHYYGHHGHQDHHERRQNDDRRSSPDSGSGAVVRREELYAVQHIPRDSSVASSTARTCVYDHRDPRDRSHRSRRYRDYDDDRSPSDEKRHQRERSRFDPRVILATLLFAATAALCYKEISSGGKKRGGRRRNHRGRPG